MINYCYKWAAYDSSGKLLKSGTNMVNQETIPYCGSEKELQNLLTMWNHQASLPNKLGLVWKYSI